MMKKVAFIFLAMSLFACGETAKKEATEEVQATVAVDSAEAVVDSAAVVADSVAVDSAATEEVVEEAAH